jgi:hypothetical protein
MGVSGPDATGARWTPIRVSNDGSDIVDWCRTDGIEFTDPFFDQSVLAALRDPFRLLFRRMTPMLDLATSAPAGLEPSGFIFHLSRCGSTLVSQLFAALPSVLVMSEPGPVDSAMRTAPGAPRLDEATRARVLRGMVAALGQPGSSDHRHYVVKLDAWALLWLPRIRAAFPDTPWALVYRDPLEILVSQSQRIGYHMIPNALTPDELGIDASGITSESTLQEYGAAVLGRLLECAVAGMDDGPALLVDYRELPDAITMRVAPWFGIEIDDRSSDRLMALAGRDAKNEAIRFEPDTAAKRRSATPAQWDLANGLAPLYERILARRADQPWTLEQNPGDSPTDARYRSEDHNAMTTRR